MILKLNEAISLISWKDVVHISDNKRKQIMLEILPDDTALDYNSPDYNKEVQQFLKLRYNGVKNEYLEKELEKVYHKKIRVEGTPTTLFPCPCCDYKSLTDRGEYSICKVCFWEDDGNTNLQKYSSVNKMTLMEAKRNFLTIGAIDEQFLKFIEPEGKQMYFYGQ